MLINLTGGLALHSDEWRSRLGCRSANGPLPRRRVQGRVFSVEGSSRLALHSFGSTTARRGVLARLNTEAIANTANETRIILLKRKRAGSGAESIVLIESDDYRIDRSGNN